MDEPRRALAATLRTQGDWCERLGSPLYAQLLRRAADDAIAGGPAWAVLSGHENDPPGSALALRFMAAVHRIVLEGASPELARFYPSAGGRADAGDPWPAFRRTLDAHAGRLGTLVELPCQTNEVGRSAALLGGFLEIAATTRLPLRLLEIGSSGGLNLRWDHYRYEARDWAWGPAESQVRFRDVFEGDSRPRAVAVEVGDRAGCDTNPIDVTTHEGRLRLSASTWPDQERRFPHLQAAMRIAAHVPATLERADAGEWLSRRLERPVEGVVTVICHSIVAQYLGREGRARVDAAVGDAAEAATNDAPLARLELEPTHGDPARGEFHVTLTQWPAGRTELLARAHPHGPPVEWLR